LVNACEKEKRRQQEKVVRSNGGVLSAGHVQLYIAIMSNLDWFFHYNLQTWQWFFKQIWV
jgi:hypothetical protein